MNSFNLVLFLFLFIGCKVQAQESNLQTYTPATLFGAGEYEVNVFNSLYTQNKGRNRNGKEVDLTETQAFFNSQIQYTRGFKKFPKINIGIEMNITSARYGAFDENGVVDFFKGGASFKKTLVSSIGPRLKFNVSKKIPRLSVQSTFLIPTSSKLQEEAFIAHDRYTWFTQLFYDRNLGKNFQIFLEADFLYRIKNKRTIENKNTNSRNFFRTPISSFLSYFPNSKSTVFVFVQHSNRYEVIENDFDKQFGLSQWFTQVGIGGKYQLTKSLGIEASYSNFVRSRMDGAGYSVNFGLRYIHR